MSNQGPDTSSCGYTTWMCRLICLCCAHLSSCRFCCVPAYIIEKFKLMLFENNLCGIMQICEHVVAKVTFGSEFRNLNRQTGQCRSRLDTGFYLIIVIYDSIIMKRKETFITSTYPCECYTSMWIRPDHHSPKSMSRVWIGQSNPARNILFCTTTDWIGMTEGTYV